MTSSTASETPVSSRDFTTIGVVGLGTMGAGIAEVFARNGFAVIGVEVTDDAVERAEDLLLDGQLLDDRLDDEAAVLHVAHVRGEGDPADELLLLVLGQLAAPYGPPGGVLDVLAAPLERLLRLLDAHHLVAVAGEDLGDAGAHGAEADDPDGGEVACAARHGAHHGTGPGGDAVR